MKVLLPLLCLLISGQLLAQNPAPYYPLNAPRVQLLDTTAKGKQLSAILKNPTPGVYRMPQDGMPCVVPDTKEIAAMPNAWKGKLGMPYQGRIPNPAVPRKSYYYKKG